MGFELLMDSSNTELSIGVVEDNKLTYKTSFPAWQRQSELMIPELEKALNATGKELKDVEKIVVGKGPGSYTGLRIAMTIAKVVGVLNGCKLVLVSSLQMLGPVNEKFIALMNARSGRSYIGVYDNGKTVLADDIMTNDDVRKYIEEHQDFKVYGDTTYLGIEGNKPDIVENLFLLKDKVEPEENNLKVKPVYLKENYEY